MNISFRPGRCLLLGVPPLATVGFSLREQFSDYVHGIGKKVVECYDRNSSIDVAANTLMKTLSTHLIPVTM
jgi:hypothetical protein